MPDRCAAHPWRSADPRPSPSAPSSPSKSGFRQGETLGQGDQRILMGEIEMKRSDRDVAVGDRFEIGRMPRRLDHRAEPEPVIIIAARIGPPGDAQPAVIADSLSAYAN